MKKLNLQPVVLCFAFCVMLMTQSFVAYAYDPIDYLTFQQYGSCIGGDLSNASFASRQKPKGEHPSNLQLANLKNTDFTRNNMVKANFSRAIINGTVFIGDDLTRANFFGAQLDHTSVKYLKAHFRGAKFKKTRWIDGRELDAPPWKSMPPKTCGRKL